MERPPDTLIGRNAELQALVAAIDADRAAVIVGEAGIGKTTLVRAAVLAAGRRAREGGGFATLDSMPYLALRRALGTGLAGDAASVAAQVELAVGPDVLFVDDLQWADADTISVLELVLGRLLVISTVRTGDARARARIEAAEHDGSTILHLDGLTDVAATEIVRRARPELSTQRTAAIVRVAAGNPLLLEELAASGVASTALGRALTARLEMLEPEARASVELVAVAEGLLPRAAVGPGIDSALLAGVAREVDGRLEVRHVLVANAILEGLDSERAAELHRRVAELVAGPLDRARHLAAAGRPAEAAAVAMGGLDAAADPRDYAALLMIAAVASPDEIGFRLRLRAARALDEVADWAAVATTLEATGELGNPNELVERDAMLAHAQFVLGEPAACRVALDRAEARAFDRASDAAARFAVERATFLVNVEGRVEAALAVLDGATAQVTGAEARRDLVTLRTSILLLAGGPGDPGIIAAGLEDAFAAGRFRTATDRARVMQYLLLFGSSAESALGFLLAQHDRFDAAGIGVAALDFQADAVLAAVLDGQLKRALLLADEILERPAPPRARQSALIHRARALTMLGRFDLAAESLTDVAQWASADFFGRGEVLAGQAELAWWSGRASAAVELATVSLAVAAPVPAAHVAAALTRAWAVVELGRDPGSELVLPLLPSLVGAPLELEGLRAWRRDDPSAAAAAFARAADGWRGFHALREIQCRWAAAESRRRDGDLDGAVGQLMDVLTAATQIGFEPLAARIRRSLRLAGGRPPVDVRGSAHNATGLTTREQQLVGLVARGLTNVEIARRLGLGRPTVARILASAMAKLGVNSRAQLAATAPLREFDAGSGRR